MVLLVVGLPTVVADVADSPIDDAFATGYLTWNAGAGEAQTEDPAGSAAPTPNSIPQPDVFISRPLPWTLHLNASRNIHVDLFVQRPIGQADLCGTQPASRLRIELFAGDSLLSASNPTIGFGHQRVANYAKEPDGFELCRYRIPAELYRIPVSTVLTLKIYYKTEGQAYKYGFFGDHASIVRLPFYLPDDVLWRDPDVVQGKSANPSSEGVVPWLSRLIGGALVAVSGAGSVGRSRLGAAWLLFAALAASSTAGCLTAPSTSEQPRSSEGLGGEDQATVTQQEATGLGLTPEGSAAIVGMIHDELFVPIGGAYVSLLGTPHFGNADAYGRFHFANLTPGPYRLRVDKETFRSLELDLTTSADNITRVDLTLLPVDPKSRDYRPHRHDYWANQTSYELINGSLDPVCPTFGSPCRIDHPTNWFFYIPPKDVPGHNVVLPGTYEVEIILDWNPAETGYAEYGLLAQANHDPAPYNVSEFAPRGPGVPFHMVTNWEMTDTGHQLFSTWKFAFFSGVAHQGTKQPMLPYPVYVPEELGHLTVRLHKGVVPLEPAHPNHWGAADRINITELKHWTQPGYQNPASVALGGCWTKAIGSQTNPTGANYHHEVSLEPFQVVPNDAERLQVVARLNHPTRAELAGAKVAEFGWTLTYKRGDQPFSDNTFQPAGPPTVSDDRMTFTWEVPVTPKTADGIYNKKSAWRFRITDDDPTEACKASHVFGLNSNPLAIDAQVVALRDL